MLTNGEGYLVSLAISQNMQASKAIYLATAISKTAEIQDL
jgi:hypothetical protein